MNFNGNDMPPPGMMPQGIMPSGGMPTMMSPPMATPPIGNPMSPMPMGTQPGMPGAAAGGFVPPNPNAMPQAFAMGGAPTSGEMGSWFTRREATDNIHNGGLFKSAVPGRTDKLDTLVPGGAYVVPADVVSGLGQGNTMAGSAILDKMFSTAPYGGRLPRSGRGGPGIPAFPGAPKRRAAGGPAGGSSHVPIIAAGGEYLIPPEVVEAIGSGDMTRGHKILDHFVVHARRKTTDEMRKLPGPKK